jgi:hypothetical protein
MSESFDRRAFVGAAGALAAAGSLGLGKALAATQGDIIAKVILPSGTHVFHSATGKDLGNYTGPNFVQRNILVRDRSIPFTVFFRPDVTSDRLELVFEWGDPFYPTASVLPAYKVEISKGGSTIATVDVPQHFWLARWRWQTSPRPFVKTREDLFNAKVFPPFRRLSPRQSLPQPVPEYTIMDTSSVTVYMPTTGERGDLGVVPEWYGAYLATGDSAMKASMMAWAESAGTFGWHMRDPKTWAPFNWNTYPGASTYYDQRWSSPHLSLLTSPPSKIHGNIFSIDMSHQPALAFLPFMLTGDLYYLEELQFMSTYMMRSSPSVQLGLLYKGQTRETAWSLRNIFDVVYATPERSTQSILPRSYWQKFLDKNLAGMMADYVHGKSLKTAVFCSGTDGGRMPFWQEDYLATVLGVAVHRGFEAWRPVFEWKLQSDIARTNGTSGWPRGEPTAYYPKPGKADISPGPNRGNGTLKDVNFDFKVVPGKWVVKFSGAEVFDVLRPNGVLDGHGKVGSTYWDSTNNSFGFNVVSGSVPFAAGDRFTISVVVAKTWGELAAVNDMKGSNDSLSTKLSFEYPQTVRASLAMGVINGVAAAEPCFKWLAPQVEASYSPGWRWSIAPSA